MRLLLHTLLLVWWGVVKHAAGNDNFAAVAGTGWTDISQLSSTCSTPGYYVNPSDCSRFYNCVDHSTPEHTLFLRYDFECPGGLAFDESTKNCNYPGPSGCVSSSSGWGWSSQRQIFQSSKGPNSWGTPTRNPVSTTVYQIPSQVTSGGSFIRVSSTTPAPLPSNPRINIPSNVQIVQIPVGTWESLRLNPLNRVFQSARTSVATSTESGGSEWSTGAGDSGVFDSAKIVHHGQSGSVAWGTSKIFPQDSGVQQRQNVRVTLVQNPQRWETPKPFPREEQGNGWSRVQVQVTPTPTPAPYNPRGWEATTPAPENQGGWQAPPPPAPENQGGWQAPPPAPENQGGWQAPPPAPEYQGRWQAGPPAPANPAIWSTPTQSPVIIQGAWQSARITPSPRPSAPATWQRITQVQQQAPAPVAWNPPQPSNPSLNFIQSNPPVANNPSVNVAQSIPPSNPTVRVPAGWENVSITRLPSGYIWQSTPNSKSVQAEISVEAPNPVASTVSSFPEANSLSAGNFGIVQQVINEDHGARQGAVNQKSHIQLVYENQEKQQNVQQQSQNVVPQNQAPQEIGSQDPANPIYQFISPPGSAFKGRIIVLYAPLNTKTGKREVPVIEVEVEDDNDNDDNNNNTDNQ